MLARLYKNAFAFLGSVYVPFLFLVCCVVVSLRLGDTEQACGLLVYVDKIEATTGGITEYRLQAYCSYRKGECFCLYILFLTAKNVDCWYLIISTTYFFLRELPFSTPELRVKYAFRADGLTGDCDLVHTPAPPRLLASVDPLNKKWRTNTSLT